MMETNCYIRTTTKTNNFFSFSPSSLPHLHDMLLQEYIDIIGYIFNSVKIEMED